jgi:hypothetical protein
MDRVGNFGLFCFGFRPAGPYILAREFCDIRGVGWCKTQGCCLSGREGMDLDFARNVYKE